jgi:hypothetical protein
MAEESGSKKRGVVAAILATIAAVFTGLAKCSHEAAQMARTEEHAAPSVLKGLESEKRAAPQIFEGLNNEKKVAPLLPSELPKVPNYPSVANTPGFASPVNQKISYQALSLALRIAILRSQSDSQRQRIAQLETRNPTSQELQSLKSMWQAHENKVRSLPSDAAPIDLKQSEQDSSNLDARIARLEAENG